MLSRFLSPGGGGKCIRRRQSCRERDVSFLARLPHRLEGEEEAEAGPSHSSIVHSHVSTEWPMLLIPFFLPPSHQLYSGDPASRNLPSIGYLLANWLSPFTIDIICTWPRILLCLILGQ